MANNYIQIYSQSLHCIKCEFVSSDSLIDVSSEFSRSLIDWFGETYVSKPEYIREQARKIGIPINENSGTNEGLCDHCYDGRSDNDIKLINLLEVYSRNIKNIEDENYKQDGAREKHDRYQLLIRDEIQKWEPRIVFMPVPVPGENRLFYVQADISKESLERLSNA